MDFSLVIWGTIIGAIAVALVVVLQIKGKASPAVPGRFDFDTHKAGELGKRGVFDKTKSMTHRVVSYTHKRSLRL